MRVGRLKVGNLIGTLVLAVLAAGFLSVAWSTVQEELRFLAGSRIVEGDVVDHVFVPGSGTGPMSSRSMGGHYPIVRFVTNDGAEHRVQGRLGAGSRQTLTEGIKSGIDAIPVGSRMRVAYRPEAPQDARVLGLGQQYLFPAIMAGIGLLLAMFALLVLRDGFRS